MACCPSIWWCTPSGPVEVTADGDGVYTRPAGATGHPFKSLADASAVCPGVPWQAVCTEGASPLTVAQLVFVTFTDKTGDLATFFPFNSLAIPIPVQPAGSGAVNTFFTLAYDVNGKLWEAGITLICSGGDWLVSFSFAPSTDTATHYGCGSAYSWSVVSPWITGAAPYKTVTAPVTVFATPDLVGTITISCGGSGTMKVTLSS